jgi:hypothetical protein
MIRSVLALLLIATPALAQDDGLAAWGRIYEVFSHPRCANCHVGPDNIPIWSGLGYGPKPRAHGMNINAGESRAGAEYIACGSCHNQHNSDISHGPPGSAMWKLPPVEMQWFGKSSPEICVQIKDQTRNGGRGTVAEIEDHVRTAELVHWGWAPGPGREPAPYSAAQLIDFLKQWDASGAPCPVK